MGCTNPVSSRSLCGGSGARFWPPVIGHDCVARGEMKVLTIIATICLTRNKGMRPCSEHGIPYLMNSITFLKGKSLYKFCNWVKLFKSLGKITVILRCKLVSQPTLYFLYWEEGCLKCQQSWERDRWETQGSFQVTYMCQTVRHFTKSLSVSTGKVLISANTTCGLKPI